MTDQETLDVYAQAAEDYAKGFARSKNTDQEADYIAFTSRLDAAAAVLDFGCGPGHWAARMRDEGYRVAAMDASAEMADYAKIAYDIDVNVASFDDLEVIAIFDGIWANFSLLHATRANFPTHLEAVHRALKPGGILSLGMKLGEDEGRDELGRFYAYYSEEELRDLLAKAGFTVVQSRRGNGKGLAGAEETFVVLTAHA